AARLSRDAYSKRSKVRQHPISPEEGDIRYVRQRRLVAAADQTGIADRSCIDGITALRNLDLTDGLPRLPDDGPSAVSVVRVPDHCSVIVDRSRAAVGPHGSTRIAS